MAYKPKHESGNHNAYGKEGEKLDATLTTDKSHMFQKAGAGKNIFSKWLHGKDGESKQAAIERLSEMGWNISSKMSGLKARKMGTQFRFELNVKTAEGFKTTDEIKKAMAKTKVKAKSEGESDEEVQD
jgi:hypothetical protein